MLLTDRETPPHLSLNPAHRTALPRVLHILLQAFEKPLHLALQRFLVIFRQLTILLGSSHVSSKRGQSKRCGVRRAFRTFILIDSISKGVAKSFESRSRCWFLKLSVDVGNGCRSMVTTWFRRPVRVSMIVVNDIVSVTLTWISPESSFAECHYMSVARD